MTNKLWWPVKNTFLLFTLTCLFFPGLVNIAAAAPPVVKFRPASIITPAFTPRDNSCELLLKSHFPLTKYSSFFLDSPHRLVVDINHADFHKKYKTITTSCLDLNEIEIARHTGKIRIVFNVPTSHDIQHRIEQDEQGLKITLEKKELTKMTGSEEIKHAAPEKYTEKDLNPASKIIEPIVSPAVQKTDTEILPLIPELDINSLLIEAEEEYTLQHYDSVIDISTRVIASDPKNAEAYSKRCGAQAMKHLYSEAYNDCIQAITIAPHAPMAYNNLGWVVEQQGNFEEALLHYNKSCELKSSLGCENFKRLQEAAEAAEAKTTTLAPESNTFPENKLSAEDSSSKDDNTPKTTKQLIKTYFPAKKITLTFFKSDIENFFSQVATMSGRKILVDPSANAPLTLNLEEIHLPEVIYSILTIYNLRIEKREDYFYIFKKEN